MVEERWASSNGNGSRSDSGQRRNRDLDKVERQVRKLEAVEGHDEETKRQIQDLQDRIRALREPDVVHTIAWEKTELARHPQRPYTLDYIERIFTEWSEIHGDRGFGDDPAIVCGMARLNGAEVMVIGHQKARDTKQKVYRNFGMPNPEGYRKALRAMKMAEKFGRPLITFGRHSGRISRPWRGRTGTSGGYRAKSARNGTTSGPNHYYYNGRGWQRRCAGDCGSGPSVDDGERRVFGDLSGRMRRYPLE